MSQKCAPTSNTPIKAGRRPQHSLIELGVICEAMQPRHRGGQVNQGRSVKIDGGIFEAALFEQRPDSVGVHALIGMHGPRAKLRKSKTGRNRRDREEDQRGDAAVLQSLLPSHHAIRAK